MALAERTPRAPVQPLFGNAKPRIAPPTPARSDVAGFRAVASEMGIELMPWQETAGRYLTATGPDGRLLYREVCIVVARQNGKTTLMKPYIIQALRAGKRIMHIAQTRELPREMFGVVADALSTSPDLFPKRRGRVLWPRFGSGSEEITLLNGGSYRIAAANRGGARGHPNDIVLIDELREMESDDVVSAAEPTLTMSTDPQMVYLSNAGTDRSIVLNNVRDRAGKDESLAYLEWSASPERAPDDRTGWTESNPAYGHYPQIERTLVNKFRSHSLSRSLAIFEAEHLCRWVISMVQPLTSATAWQDCYGEVEHPRHVVMGIAMDASSTRASAAIAWPQSDGSTGVRLLADVTGAPIDTATFADALKTTAKAIGFSVVGFDDWTDKELAKHFKSSKAIGGKDYANASENFVRLVESRQIRWDIGDAITDELAYTARKTHDSGAWSAAQARPDKPITGVRAAIRAVWLASGPKPTSPRVM